MTKEELKQYLVDECEYKESRVESLSPYEMVNAWLRYEGIINYTDIIIEVVSAAYGIELD